MQEVKYKFFNNKGFPCTDRQQIASDINKWLAEKNATIINVETIKNNEHPLHPHWISGLQVWYTEPLTQTIETENKIPTTLESIVFHDHKYEALCVEAMNHWLSENNVHLVNIERMVGTGQPPLDFQGIRLWYTAQNSNDSAETKKPSISKSKKLASFEAVAFTVIAIVAVLLVLAIVFWSSSDKFSLQKNANINPITSLKIETQSQLCVNGYAYNLNDENQLEIELDYKDTKYLNEVRQQEETTKDGEPQLLIIPPYKRC